MYKDANPSRCRIKDDGTTPWSPTRNILPEPGPVERPDFGCIERGENYNALCDGRTLDTFRAPGYGRKQKSR